LAEVQRGVDPGATKMQTEAKREGDMVEALVADYVERYVKKNTRPTTQAATVGVLEKIVLPAWRGRTVHDVKRRDVVELVARVTDERGPYMANRVLAALSKFFGWLLARAASSRPRRSLACRTPASRTRATARCPMRSSR